jgi:hypothetical protein
LPAVVNCRQALVDPLLPPPEPEPDDDEHATPETTHAAKERAQGLDAREWRITVSS